MMRKDEEEEEEIVPTFTSIPRRIKDEDELDDEDLLGESTRAKIVFEKRHTSDDEDDSSSDADDEE
jgi:hypothetical protein